LEELCKYIEAFEMQCYQRSMHTSYKEHVTNDEVLKRQEAVGSGEITSRKLKYFGHITRHNSLEKDIMLSTMPGKRQQGGQKKQWLDDITQRSKLGRHGPIG